MAHGQLFYDQIRSGGVSVKTGNYTIVESDAWSLIASSPSSSPLTTYTMTLPATPSSFRRVNWWVAISNYGGGIVTVSPNGRQLDGIVASINLTPNQSVLIGTDGTNYFTERGIGGGLSSPLNTKGDLWGYSTGNARIPIGANGTFLEADSTQTLGMKWGSPPPPGAPWLNITDPTTVTYAWHNQGSSTVTVNSTQKSIYLYQPASASAGFSGREITAPASPVSITIGIIPQIHNAATNFAGLYVTDGTKLVVAGMADTTGNSGNSLIVQQQNTFAGSFNATLAGPGVGYFISPIFLKVVDDGTNLKWYWSVDGLGFILLFSGLRTAFLASISAIGFFAGSFNASLDAAVLLISWAQGTS